jgi:preprotein translocase subunit SecE
MGEEVTVRKAEGTRKADSNDALEQAKGAWQHFRQYVYEVRTETKRVSWPGKQEIYGTTMMVILTTFLFGFYFAICDRTFGFSMTHLLNYLRHH